MWLHGGSNASPLSSRSLARVAALEHAPTQTRPLFPTHPTHPRQLVPPRLWPAECAATRSASRRYMARLGTLRGTARRAPVVLCHRFECVVCLRPCVAAAFSGYEALTNSCATPPASVAADCPISLTESSASATQDSNIHTARCRRVCTSSLRLFPRDAGPSPLAPHARGADAQAERPTASIPSSDETSEVASVTSMGVLRFRPPRQPRFRLTLGAAFFLLRAPKAASPARGWSALPAAASSTDCGGGVLGGRGPAAVIGSTACGRFPIGCGLHPPPPAVTAASTSEALVAAEALVAPKALVAATSVAAPWAWYWTRLRLPLVTWASSS